MAARVRLRAQSPGRAREGPVSPVGPAPDHAQCRPQCRPLYAARERVGCAQRAAHLLPLLCIPMTLPHQAAAVILTRNWPCTWYPVTRVWDVVRVYLPAFLQSA